MTPEAPWTIPALRTYKVRDGRTPLVMLTAYTAPLARLLDGHADMVLVGDSLGMVVYGFPSTLPVTLDMMIAHGKAVAGATRRALVVVDMPFGRYQASPESAWTSAARLLAETGCAAVKLEGGVVMAETVRFLVQRGIPVMGHLGLTPQSVQILGGYKMQGPTPEAGRALREDAKALEDAGAFSVVVEAVPEPLGRAITEAVSIPVIGIGASPACDGQVLVTEDLLGFSGLATPPRFVKRYADLGRATDEAITAFAADVREGRFPGPSNVYASPRPKKKRV